MSIVTIGDLPTNDDAEVFGNTLLCESIKPLPMNPYIEQIEDSRQNINEYHMVIRKVGSGPYGAFLTREDGQCVLQPGDRVLVNGRPVPVTLNYRQYWIVDCNTVKARITSDHPIEVCLTKHRTA